MMWRVAPTAELVVSVKRNPGQHVHRACGVRAATTRSPRVPAPALTPGAAGVLAAAIDGDTLAVTIDGAEVWRGPLPAAARELRGPAGVRSDNVVWRAPGGAAGARGRSLRCARPRRLTRGGRGATRHVRHRGRPRGQPGPRTAMAGNPGPGRANR
ncbi:MAG: hypothetical protein IPL61_38540 [Myxococcales bacterium]|nr:hypothetical protein [Myxococcales bacterium]